AAVWDATQDGQTRTASVAYDDLMKDGRPEGDYHISITNDAPKKTDPKITIVKSPTFTSVDPKSLYVTAAACVPNCDATFAGTYLDAAHLKAVAIAADANTTPIVIATL